MKLCWDRLLNPAVSQRGSEDGHQDTGMFPSISGDARLDFSGDGDPLEAARGASCLYGMGAQDSSGCCADCRWKET